MEIHFLKMGCRQRVKDEGKKEILRRIREMEESDIKMNERDGREID